MTTQVKQTIIVFGILIVGFIVMRIWNQNIAYSEETSQTQQREHISVQDAYTLIQEHQEDPNFVILDVRTPGEFSQGHLEKAINIDYYSNTFQTKLQELDQQKTYLVYCRSGNRSNRTLRTMKDLGFSSAYNMLGGISHWYAQKLPIVK